MSKPNISAILDIKVERRAMRATRRHGIRVMARIARCSIILLLLMGGVAMAESGIKRPELRNNMAYYDVLKLWGAPTAKLERESKREDVWLYGQDKVIFSDGKVVAWMTESSQAQAESAAQSQTAKVKAAADEPADEGEVEAILKDILAEPGDGVAPAGGGQPSMPVLPPPQVINPGEPAPLRILPPQGG